MQKIQHSLLGGVLSAIVLMVVAGYTTTEVWGAPKGTLRIAVVNFDRESTAQWLGATPMLPYIGNMNDPFIAADEKGQLSKDGIVTEMSEGPPGPPSHGLCAHCPQPGDRALPEPPGGSDVSGSDRGAGGI
jgi:hypothetical protein